MDSDTLRIKVFVADRSYPLNIKREDEEKVRRAASQLAALMKKLEGNYSVEDKQDLLAMCALQLAVKLETHSDKVVVDADVVERLRTLEQLIREKA
jgi:cell division protein ZapA